MASTAGGRLPCLADPLKEATNRMMYMERLLKHHVPDLDPSLEGLRRACDALTIPSPSSDPAGVQVPSAEPEVGSPGIEDENCTLDNVDGAIAREHFPKVSFSTDSC